ncbi:MAG: toll/interleukin-1 receptor domain-containing protein [Microthrixaceae bacterium]
MSEHPAQVFISWAHTDEHRPRIEALVAALADRGVTAFVDFERVGDGDHLPDTIRRAIDGARMLLVWWTDEYQVSSWCRSELYRTLLASAIAPPTDPTRTPARTRGRVAPIVVANPDEAGIPAGLDALAGSLGDRLIAGPVPSDDGDAVERLADRVVALLGCREFAAPIGAVDRGAPATPVGVRRSALHYQRFVGRLVEVWRLHEALTRTSDDPLALGGASSNRVALVKGGGGFGKSLLATHYQDRFGPAWSRIVWMRALGNPTGEVAVDRGQALDDAWTAVAAEFGVDVGDLTVDQKRREVTRRIDAAEEPVLWIVDDLASDDEPDDWVCDSGRCAVIVTTRSETLREMTVIDVGGLSEGEALALFGRHGLDVRAERAAAIGLAEWLGFHALAIDVAGAYMAKAGLGFAGYRAKIESSLERFDELTRTLDLRLPGGHEPQIVATLATSIQRLRADGQFLVRAAADLAQAPIPEQLVEALLRFRTDHSGAATTQGAADALFVANGDGLWRVEADGDQRSMVVHTLAAATARQLVPVDGADVFRERLCAAAFAVVDRVPWADVSRHGEIVPVLPHARALAGDRVEPTGSAGLRLWNAVLLIDTYAGSWTGDDSSRARFLTQRERCHGAHRRILGDDHPDTLTAKANLAVSLRALGDAAAARTLQQDVLDARRRILGDDHPDTLTAKANLAVSLRALGDAAAARTLQQDVLDARRRILGDDHPDTLTAKANLAASLRALGDAAAARTLQQDVLDASRRILGDDHPDTLTAKANLADSLRALGDAAAARTLQQDVLDARRRILGDDHPDTLTAKANLADSLRALGDAAAARTLQQDVLDASRRILGDDHPDTLTAKANLAGGDRPQFAGARRRRGGPHTPTRRARRQPAHPRRRPPRHPHRQSKPRRRRVEQRRARGCDRPDGERARGGEGSSRRRAPGHRAPQRVARPDARGQAVSGNRQPAAASAYNR